MFLLVLFSGVFPDFLTAGFAVDCRPLWKPEADLGSLRTSICNRRDSCFNDLVNQFPDFSCPSRRQLCATNLGYGSNIGYQGVWRKTAIRGKPAILGFHDFEVQKCMQGHTHKVKMCELAF